MAASEARRAAAARGLPLLLLLGAGLACASGGAPERGVETPASVQEPLTPPPSAEEPAAAAEAQEEVPEEEAQEEAQEASEEAPEEPDAPGAERPHPGTGVVVISEGRATEEETLSLYEASERARRERAGAAPRSGSSLTITNETLEQHAAGGRISFGGGQEAVAAEEEETAGEPGAAEEPAEEGSEPAAEPATGGADEQTAAAERPLEQRNPELYWRDRVREARLRWREAVERVEELQGLAEQLRYDFYATDDPWLRDSSIKPAWDRTLVELEEARQDVDFQRRTVEAVLLEGRRSGALPGWLREGLELEPDESRIRRPAAFDEHEAIEPVEAEDDDADEESPGDGG